MRYPVELLYTLHESECTAAVGFAWHDKVWMDVTDLHYNTYYKDFD